MITNEQAFQNGDYKTKNVLVNVDKLPLHKQILIKRVYEGMNQTELAKILQLSDAAALSRIEQGKRAVGEHLIERVERYLYEQTYIDGQLVQEGDES